MSQVYEALSRLALATARAGVRLPHFREHAERLGRLPEGLRGRTGGRAAIWVHNASVGELRAAIPLVRALRQLRPEARIVLSATSLAGRRLAAGVPEAAGAFLLPLDARPAVRGVVDALQPSLFVFTETEIWPTLLAELGGRSIPAAMLSGRISAQSFPGYRRIRPLLRDAFAHVRLFGMQSEDDAERIRDLGAPAPRVIVTGSLKLDVAETPQPFPIAGGGPLWIAGSTHPGEERACLEAFERLRGRFPDLRLLLAPRHLDRLREVVQELERSGVAWTRRSRLEGGWSESPPVLLLDTLGELAGLWPRATVGFVGGSLAPVGGHNLLEPARAGVPVLFGPHVANVEAAARGLEEGGGGRRVRSTQELADALAALLGDAGQHERASRAATTAFPPGEVTRRSLDALSPWLPGGGA